MTMKSIFLAVSGNVCGVVECKLTTVRKIRLHVLQYGHCLSDRYICMNKKWTRSYY